MTADKPETEHHPLVETQSNDTSDSSTSSSSPDELMPATEARHPDTHDLDRASAAQILDILHAEDRVALDAVTSALPALARLVDEATTRLRRGGRVHYFGAGTSGRLGVLDAAELVPTFGTDPDLVQGHIAGGEPAILHAVENSEDADFTGRTEALDTVSADDVVIGITVSGTTPYVRGALEGARARGAYTALITSNPGSPLSSLSDEVVAAATGPEVLTGSTRLKAGTATKVILNGFSTAVMIRSGRTYSNLMVSVLATNEKLRARTLRILGEITEADAASNVRLLDAAGGDLRTAIVSAVAGVDAETANRALVDARFSVRDSIDHLTHEA